MIAAKALDIGLIRMFRLTSELTGEQSMLGINIVDSPVKQLFVKARQSASTRRAFLSSSNQHLERVSGLK